MGNLDNFTAAVGQAWDKIALEHPEQAQSIEQNFGDGDIVLAIQQTLAKDAAYAALVAQTNAEVDVANLIPLVLPFVLTAIQTLVGAGLLGGL
jgi:hypothetical protein